MAMIDIRGLTKKFGDITAVDDLTFNVEEGEVLGLLGPNGAGKTTTIRMLAGIISPTSGFADIGGRRTDKNAEELHEIIGLLTETPGFYNNLSARRNLEFYAGFYPGLDIPRQIEKYLKMMGLWERRENKVGTYSKGMKQRLALVRALLHEPKVLFLDEPTSGLDPEAASEVKNIVKQLRADGRTILLSTHNLDEAEQLCRRIAIVKTRLIAIDTPGHLRETLFRRKVVVQLESVPESVVSAIAKLPFVLNAAKDGDRLIVELTDAEKNRPELVKRIVDAGGQVMGVSEETHSLEDIYLSLVRENNREP
jgi:ABC-2 type transport system ATP-binding protein